jgi:hypothetical protein
MLTIFAEIAITFFKLLPYLLWLYINYFFLNRKITRNRKKMAKALEREGLPKHVSEKIAEHIFPRIDLQQWQTPFIQSGRIAKSFGRQN